MGMKAKKGNVLLFNTQNYAQCLYRVNCELGVMEVI